MKKQFFVISLLFFSISAFAQNSDVDQIKKLNLEWLNAYPKKDTATLNRILSKDFVMITNRGMQINKESLMATIAKSNGILSFKNDSVEVKVYGTTALLTGYGTSMNSKNGKADIGQNCYSSLFVKENRTWQAVETFIMAIKKGN